MRKPVYVWLLMGIVLIFVQVVIGGITRLTGSGLSITKWEVVTGTIPPLNADAWSEAFDLYKETPQYEKLNRGMSLSEFKWIYFWEYLHRLWARSMGFIFLIPFIFFVARGWLSSVMIKRLLVVFLLAGLVGVFGWIMVASGLVDRPWVNAYKLSLHLGLALLVLGYLLWVTLQYRFPKAVGDVQRSKAMRYFIILIGLQIFLGGIMSGVKASLVYPEWPDYKGAIWPTVLLDGSAWSVDNFVNYDESPMLAALVQFLHRSIGYVLIISILYMYYRYKVSWKSMGLQHAPRMLIILLITQIVLGVGVLLKSIGTVPVGLGVAHQMVAIAILMTAVYIHYFGMKPSKY